MLFRSSVIGVILGFAMTKMEVSVIMTGLGIVGLAGIVVKNGILVIEFTDFGLAGLRCDVKGNIYQARFGKGTIVKISPDGRILKEITLLGKRPTNVAFGGPDGRTMYVTLQDQGNLEKFRVDDPGREWKMSQEQKL